MVAVAGLEGVRIVLAGVSSLIDSQWGRRHCRSIRTATSLPHQPARRDEQLETASLPLLEEWR